MKLTMTKRQRACKKAEYIRSDWREGLAYPELQRRIRKACTNILYGFACFCPTLCFCWLGRLHSAKTQHFQWLQAHRYGLALDSMGKFLETEGY
jgi:hypothetical protein